MSNSAVPQPCRAFTSFGLSPWLLPKFAVTNSISSSSRQLFPTKVFWLLCFTLSTHAGLFLCCSRQVFQKNTLKSHCTQLAWHQTASRPGYGPACEQRSANVRLIFIMWTETQRRANVTQCLLDVKLITHFLQMCLGKHHLGTSQSSFSPPIQII